MRILHITNNYTPYNGGVVHAINNIMNEQIKIYPTACISFNFDNTTTKVDPAHIYRIWSPLNFFYKKNPMILPYNIHEQLAHLIIGFKPTIIHLHHPFLLGITALNIAQHIQCPTIYTYHTFYHQYLHYNPLQISLLNNQIQKEINNFCHRVNGIIAPSSTTAYFLKNEKITTETLIIPSPIADSFFDKTHFKMPLQKRKIRLLSLGRFTPEKNLFALFDLCLTLPQDQYELIIAGFGHLQTALEKKAYHEHKLSSETVKFIINPSEGNIKNLYEWADLFLFTSTTDTQGLVLAEALASQVPVMYYDGPGQRDIMIHGYNGYQINNNNEFIHLVDHLYNNPQIFDQMRINSLETAKKYQSSVITKKILNYYQMIYSNYKPYKPSNSKNESTCGARPKKFSSITEGF